MKTLEEYPYSNLKQQWDFSYVLTKKGISRSIFYEELRVIAYNLGRIVDILTKDSLKEYLRVLVSPFFDLFEISFRHFN